LALRRVRRRRLEDCKTQGALSRGVHAGRHRFHAARTACIDRGTPYAWLRNDPEYAKAFSDAEEEAVQNLEAEARRRAVEGVEKPVFYRGSVVGKIREYSDPLLIFLFKARRPGVYRHPVSITRDATKKVLLT